MRNKGHYILGGRKRRVSWHYTVDDKRVIQQLPIRELAYHAGRGNRKSIAIETCMHAGLDQDAANDRLARLVAVLLHDLGLDRSRVVPHKHWTGKNCPRLLLPMWEEFLDKVDDYLQGIDRGSMESIYGVAENAEDGEMAHEAIAEEVNAMLTA